jgi:hypothetical protein
VLTKLCGVPGAAALAFTVIVTELPMLIVPMSTSKLDAVNVGVPDVLVTLVIVSHAGKSASVTCTPWATNVPAFETLRV